MSTFKNLYPVTLLLCLAAGGAAAQDAPETVTDAAADAFGAQVGLDRVGLYNENQVRGFDLMQSGAYRIEDHYFARAAALPESLMESLSVNVGLPAATLALPSPSGVVVYRLRRPDPQTPLKFNVGRRDFGQVHSDVQWSLASPDRRFGLVGTVVAEPVTWTSYGQTGYNYDGGLIASFCASGESCARLFASRVDRAYNGDTVYNPVSDIEPPHVLRETNYAPGWARTRTIETSGGLLMDGRLGAWTLAGSMTVSKADARRSDTAVLDMAGDGTVHRTTYVRPRVGAQSTAVEARATRDFVRGDWRHAVAVSLRGRRSDTDLAEAVAFDGGEFALRGPIPDQAAPVLPSGGPLGRDTVAQTITSLTWRVDWRNTVDLRIGAHASNYRKTVRPPSGPQADLTRDSLFFNGSVLWQVQPRLRLFASYVSGPEESGVAPSSAVNRGDVLEPVEARQWEVGATYAVTPGLNLIVAHFDITKPVAGLRSDGVYTLVGDVRHTGDEVSLSGKLKDGTSIVVGAVALEPRLSGERVIGGAAHTVPAGVSRLNLTANVERQLTDVWSADAQLIYEGPRRMRADTVTEVEGVAFLTIGATRTFRVSRGSASLRFQIVNAFADTGYYATSSNALFPVWGRTYRVILSRGF